MDEMKEINLFLVDEGVIEKDLSKLLKNKKDNNLEISKNVYGIHKKDKDKVYELIINKVTNKDSLKEYIGYLLDNEIKLLKELIVNNGLVINNNYMYQDYFYLKSLCILDVVKIDDKLNFFIPDDVLNVLKDIDIDQCDNSKKNTKIYKLLNAMINHYGVVSFDDLEYTYNRFYNDELKIDKCILSFEFRSSMICYYCKDNKEYFINEGLNDFESLTDFIIDRQKDIERKLINEDELMKYVDSSYYDETPQSNALKDFLAKHVDNDYIREEFDFIMSYIHESLRFGINEMFDVLDTFDMENVRFTEKEAATLVELIYGVYDVSYVWLNNGWNSLEFISKFGQDKFVDYINFDAKDDCCCDDDCCSCEHDECECDDHECKCHGDHECHCKDHECQCHKDEEK